MPTLRTEYFTILGAFARLFSKRIWEPAQILLWGAILSPAERTVTATLPFLTLLAPSERYYPGKARKP